MLTSMLGFLLLALKWVTVGIWVVLGIVFATAWVFAADLKGTGPAHAKRITWYWFKGALIWILGSFAAAIIIILCLFGVNMIYEIVLKAIA